MGRRLEAVVTAGSKEAVWRQKTTCLPASPPSTKPTMASLPILLLFLFHGIEAQTEQTVDAPRTGALHNILGNVLHIKHALMDNNGEIKVDHFSLVIQRLDSVDSEVELIIQAAIGVNKTLNQLVKEDESLRNRQSAEAVLQVIQLLMVILYFLVIGIAYLVKCFEKARAKQLEQNLQEMEERLQERKNKRRSASKPPKEL